MGAVKPVGGSTALGLHKRNGFWARITTLHMLFKLRVWRDKYLSNKQDPPVSLFVEFATCSLPHNRVRYLT